MQELQTRLQLVHANIDFEHLNCSRTHTGPVYPNDALCNTPLNTNFTLNSFYSCLVCMRPTQQLLDKKISMLLPKVDPDKMDTNEEGSRSHSNSRASCGGGIVGAIVQLCVDVMLQCLGLRSDCGSYSWEQQGKLVPQHLVRSIDFECVLCTG